MKKRMKNSSIVCLQEAWNEHFKEDVFDKFKSKRLQAIVIIGAEFPDYSETLSYFCDAFDWQVAKERKVRMIIGLRLATRTRACLFIYLLLFLVLCAANHAQSGRRSGLR
jgi:hypothetical protein